MKKYLFLIGLFLLGLNYSLAQEEAEKFEPKSAVKFNFVPLVWDTYSLQYEHKIGKHFSLALTGNLRPEKKVPFSSTIQKAFGDEDLDYTDNAFDVDKLKYSTWALSPEVKWYPSKKGALRGFYLAAFAKYEVVDVNYEYYLEWTEAGVSFNEDLPLNGDIKALSGGVYIGVQWKLAKHIYLDWQIIGGNFGSGTATISAKYDLTPEQQEVLRDFAADLKDEVSELDYEVNNKGAKIWGDIPWAGLRTGLSIAYVF